MSTAFERKPRPYADPYLAGVALGLVLLAAFVIMGRGLGASGAFATTASGIANAMSPESAHRNAYFAKYLGEPGGPWKAWLLFEIVGVVIGGFLSAKLAGRFQWTVEKGPRLTERSRLTMAFGGGTLMGLGAVLARGCTSGQALTGGALLSVGSWLFMIAAFAAAYAVAPLVRRLWT
ncbi:MAG: YeeE/YedE thiosulfate transporter family protein [Gemmatimonadaceae bacterium]